MYGYNNGYGYGYGIPQYYTPTQPAQAPQSSPTPTDERIWVQGEAAAKAYLVANGATVTLWDSEKPRIFIKTVAANGFPSLQILNYTVDAPAPTPAPATDLEPRVKQLETALAELRKTINAKGENDDV